MAEHAGEADLPHGPLFGVADEETLVGLLEGAGFRDSSVQAVAATWSMPSIDALLQAFGTWAQIDTFPVEIRNAIEDSVRAAAGRYETADGLTVPNPMVLLSGARPS